MFHLFRADLPAVAAEALSKFTGCKQSYGLMDFPNHNRVLQVFPDAMHTIKDCIERIFYLIVGKVNLDTIL